MFNDSREGIRIYVEESNAVAASSGSEIAATPTSAYTPPTVPLNEHFTDEVDEAATAMLVLKHGACAFDIKAGMYFNAFPFSHVLVIFR